MLLKSGKCLSELQYYWLILLRNSETTENTAGAVVALYLVNKLIWQEEQPKSFYLILLCANVKGGIKGNFVDLLEKQTSPKLGLTQFPWRLFMKFKQFILPCSFYNEHLGRCSMQLALYMKIAPCQAIGPHVRHRLLSPFITMVSCTWTHHTDYSHFYSAHVWDVLHTSAQREILFYLGILYSLQMMCSTLESKIGKQVTSDSLTDLLTCWTANQSDLSTRWDGWCPSWNSWQSWLSNLFYLCANNLICVLL